MRHRSGLTTSGPSRLSWKVRALGAAAALSFQVTDASAQPSGSRRADGTPSAVELAAGACRLERWAAAVDLMQVVDRQERRAQDWLCLARAQLHTGQWVAALDSYDELLESEPPAAEKGAPPRNRPGKSALGKTAGDRTAGDRTAGGKAASAKAALATAQLAPAEARQLGAVERQDLEEQLAWLEIVPSSALPVSVKLSLDGEPIARSRIGVAFPVQPGAHAFAVEVSGVVRELEHWRVAEGERRRVHLSLPAERSAQQAVTSRRPVQRQPQPQPAGSELARWRRGALYVGGIGISAGVALLATSARGENVENAGVQVGIGSVVLGGMSLLTGAGLLLAEAFVGSGPNEAVPAASQQPALQPWVSSHSAGISGRF